MRTAAVTHEVIISQAGQGSEMRPAHVSPEQRSGSGGAGTLVAAGIIPWDLGVLGSGSSCLL